MDTSEQVDLPPEIRDLLRQAPVEWVQLPASVVRRSVWAAVSTLERKGLVQLRILRTSPRVIYEWRMTEEGRARGALLEQGVGAAAPAVPGRAGLPAPFREQLEKALARVRRHDEMLAVLCLDLGAPGSVDGRLDPSTAGVLLPAVERRLRGCIRDTDAAARLGERFAIFQVRLERPADAGTLARRIVDAVGRPYDLNGRRLEVDVAVGIALAPSDGTDPDSLMSRAEEAVVRAKREGRGNIRFFDSDGEAREGAG